MQNFGYRYIMQTDDDSFLLQPVARNLVTEMELGEKFLAARFVQKDDPAVMWGLAELAKYFIMTESIMPSTLFDHCTPKDINGVYSRQVIFSQECQGCWYRYNTIARPITVYVNIKYRNCVILWRLKLTSWCAPTSMSGLKRALQVCFQQ